MQDTKFLQYCTKESRLLCAAQNAIWCNAVFSRIFKLVGSYCVCIRDKCTLKIEEFIESCSSSSHDVASTVSIQRTSEIIESMFLKRMKMNVELVKSEEI